MAVLLAMRLVVSFGGYKLNIPAVNWRPSLNKKSKRGCFDA